MIIIISIFIGIGAFFTANVPFNEKLSLISIFSMIFLAIPSFYFFIKSVGKKNGFIILTLLSIFALAIETFAIQTGFPYGEFTYGGKLGYKLFGVTPWTVPFAWVPLVLGSVTLASLFTKNLIKIILLSTLILVCTDLVLDPGAVSLEFWTYKLKHFYGVPWSNFFGWMLSGLIGSSIVVFFIKKLLLKIHTSISYFFILLFWTNIAFWQQLWIPFIIGILLIFLLYFYAFCKKI